MISSHDLANEIKVSHNLSDDDLAFIFAFILLKEHGIITIRKENNKRYFLTPKNKVLCYK